jgi:hypothetical protein
MACEYILDKDGKVMGIICSRGSRAPKCKFCGKVSAKLCDFPVHGSKQGKTCDAPMCDDHATSVGEDRDFCPDHCRQEEMQLETAERAAEMRELAGMRAGEAGRHKATASADEARRQGSEIAGAQRGLFHD